MEKLNKFTKIFRKIYYKLFIENFKGKLNYNFTENFYRWDLIEYLIKLGHHVINVDKVNYSSNFYNLKNIEKNKRYKFYRLNINNKN